MNTSARVARPGPMCLSECRWRKTDENTDESIHLQTRLTACACIPLSGASLETQRPQRNVENKLCALCLSGRSSKSEDRRPLPAIASLKTRYLFLAPKPLAQARRAGLLWGIFPKYYDSCLKTCCRVNKTRIAGVNPSGFLKKQTRQPHGRRVCFRRCAGLERLLMARLAAPSTTDRCHFERGLRT